ncbi:uncharacterized protein LOC120128346 [Hibiscus syriacus]|uniref:uncharacterized protein LOC120128346 n=1 Tax=Hibiscus syriacus TaxID=106335 RepID=UPI001923B0C1|nr:uncharacterized protein LOC120128346 [Hibiscus syriacus]
MEDSNNYGHRHPLVLLNEDQLISSPSGVVAVCSSCREKVSAPCFRCAEDCGSYLHKWGLCDFCYKRSEKPSYHCSCSLDLHIKCAWFTFNISQNNLKELQHVALEDPLISTKKDDEQLDDVPMCFGCWEPLANYTYFSPDCGFNLHKKCVELPLKLNHPCHRKHPLLLQFNSDRLACKICQETRRRGFVYCCSTCKFAIHIECVSPSPPPIIEDKSHQHPFTLFWRRVPFICDACGTEGNHVAYTCGTCSIILHKRCVSLPRIIKSKWHDRRLFHKYFQHEEDFRTSYCIICHEEVNADHGSYSCSKCNVIFLVNCVMEDEDSYSIVENEDDESLDIYVSSITNVLEWNDTGEATLIQHFKHIHHLILSDRSRTNVINIFFLSLIMTITVIQKVIIVIIVKKVEIQNFRFIIVQPAICLSNVERPDATILSMLNVHDNDFTCSDSEDRGVAGYCTWKLPLLFGGREKHKITQDSFKEILLRLLTNLPFSKFLPLLWLLDFNFCATSEGDMEVSKNYWHQHPLVLLNEEQLITHQSGVIADCSRCGEVSAPCFRSAEDCGFYVHKVCAGAPFELNHPLHQHHPLVLMQTAKNSIFLHL